MKRYIVVQTKFEGIHCWPECPIDEVAFLRYPHRHEFHVKVKFPVTHTDRDREFIVVKREIEATLKTWDVYLGRMSCEDMCDKIHKEYPDACFISVFEDGENGAETEYD